jgi:hypothetical protein
LQIVGWCCACDELQIVWRVSLLGVYLPRSVFLFHLPVMGEYL